MGVAIVVRHGDIGAVCGVDAFVAVIFGIVVVVAGGVSLLMLSISSLFVEQVLL
jgi:hypothetical protein